MDFFIENWFVIIAVFAIVVGIIVAVIKFIKSGKASQIANLKEWLLYATTEAEKALGSGTGKLKLRTVYDMFLTKFLWLAKVISFDMFSGLVDEALEDMNDLLTNNAAVHLYVNGPDEDDDDLRLKDNRRTTEYGNSNESV